MKRRWIILLVGMLVLDIGIGCWWWHRWKEHRYDKVIYAAAVQYGIAPELVKAVVWKESRFNAQARGRAGEYGLMQIRAAAANEWAAAEHLSVFHPVLLLDPGTNTRAGAWYLRKLLLRYTNSDNAVVYALADYNAGRGNVLCWYKGQAITNSSAFMGLMDFSTTTQYINEILRKQMDYQGTFPTARSNKP
jgi:soluble lytic murein transglycosylase